MQRAINKSRQGAGKLAPVYFGLVLLAILLQNLSASAQVEQLPKPLPDSGAVSVDSSPPGNAAFANSLDDFKLATPKSAESATIGGFEMRGPVSDVPGKSIDDQNFEILSSHDLLASGTADVQDGRLDLAVKKFKEIIRRDPTNVSAHNNLAVVLKRQGNKEAAVDEFQKALLNNPNTPELYNNLAAALIAVGRYDQAQDALFRALRLNPDFSDAHRNLGHILFLKGDYDGSISAFQEALKENPALSEIHINLGDCYRQAHRYEQALVEYRTFVRLCPKRPDDLERHIQLCLAKCYEGLGNYEDSRKILNALIEKNPNDTDSLNCLGVVLWKMHQLPEAVFVLNRALKIDPKYPQARNNLGIALYELKRFDDAVDVWKEALAVKPDYPEAHYNMGVALYQSGLFEPAIEAYRECLRLAPNDAFAHNNLGVALLRSGNRAGALAEWHKAIECDANCAQAYTNLGKILKESAVKTD